MNLLFFTGLLASCYFVGLGIVKKNHLVLLGATLCSLNFLGISQIDLYTFSPNNNQEFFPARCLFLTLPIFLLYLKSISISPMQKRDYIILIPGIVELFFVGYQWNIEEPIWSYASFSWQLYMILAFLFNVFLALFGLCKLRSHLKSKYFMYSYYGKRHIEWGKKILFTVVLSLVIHLSLYFLQYTELITFLNNCYNITMLVFLIAIGFATKNIHDFGSKSEYKVACKIELYKVLNKIKEYLFSTEVYLDNTFSQLDLCNALELTPHKISTVINTLTDKSFNSYINNIRIQKAIIYLNDDKYQHYTIDAIAKEVGFNSKSVFYREFRKTTSFTPLRYKKLFLI